MDLAEHMPLVWAVVRRLFPAGERDPRVRRAGGLDDLAQEGYLALCAAAGAYDPARGALSTWLWQAVYWRVLRVSYREGVVRSSPREDADRGPAASRARRCGRLGSARARRLVAPRPGWPAPEDVEAARHAVASLPEAQRRALADSLRGDTFAAAARAAGRNATALRVTWLRAVARCRRRLRETGCLG